MAALQRNAGNGAVVQIGGSFSDWRPHVGQNEKRQRFWPEASKGWPTNSATSRSENSCCQFSPLTWWEQFTQSTATSD